MRSKVPLPLPDHIRTYAFDFRWDNQLLWQLDVSTETMPIEKLLWHFDVPWLHTIGGRFDLKPADIMKYPDIYVEQYKRTMESDVSYPIDVMFNKGNWLILDGLHRLMKLNSLGETEVVVRKIPSEMIPLIAK